MKYITEYKEDKIILFRLTNSSGAYVEVLNYGASVISVVVPDKNGIFNNVVLSYANIEDYFTDKFYLGATIGRYANRISKAQFAIDGAIYHLDQNDGANSNHGGFNGFNKKVFDYSIENDNIIFSAKSIDGEGGFPGNMNINVSYSFTEKNELIITYATSSDKATPVNLTNHSYFNLAGNKMDILDHELKVNSSEYLEMNDEFLPTGKIHSSSDNSAFNFQEYSKIGENLILKEDNLKGYNAFYLKNQNSPLEMPLASVKDDLSGRKVDLYTSMPGFMFYTGDFLSDEFLPFEGLCLEAQYHPDGVNYPHFISNILTPDIEKVDWIKYHFYV